MKGFKADIFRIILCLVISLGFQSGAFAAEKVSLQDKLTGSTFKTLAKGFVAVMDIDKFKKENISKINRITPDKHEREYAKVYEVIKELPSDLKIKYGIVANMPREQLIKYIESLDKKKAYELIDSIPDTFIAKEFKKYLNEKIQGIQDSNLVKEINAFWNKALAKVQEPVLKK